jgi:hypothetical protein
MIFYSGTNNASAIYRQNVAIYYQYLINLGKMGIGSAIAANTTNVIVDINQGVAKIGYYLILLAQQYSQAAISLVNLYFFKEKHCTCPINVAQPENASVLNSNILFNEAPLVSHEKNLSNYVAIATTRLNTAINEMKTYSGTTSTIFSIYFNLLSNLLTNLARISDYDSAGWTNVTNCNDLQGNVGYVRFKIFQYFAIIGRMSFNYSLAVAYSNAINVTFRVSTGFTATQNVSLTKANEAMLDVQNCYFAYLTNMNFAIFRLATIYGEVLVLNNKFCSCFDTVTTTIATTTTSK